VVVVVVVVVVAVAVAEPRHLTTHRQNLN